LPRWSTSAMHWLPRTRARTALQVTGHEAAAHGGLVTSLVLVPAIVKKVKIPVVAIGGFADGKGFVAALALGAEAVGMGTRLSLTRESPVHEKTKKAQIQAGIDDTLYSDRFDGLWCRVLKTRTAEETIKQGMNLPRAALASVRIANDLKLPWFKLAIGTMMQGPKTMIQLAHMAAAFDKIKKASDEGDLEKGVHLTGQVQGLIDDIPTVTQVINGTIKEAKDIYKRMGALLK